MKHSIFALAAAGLHMAKGISLDVNSTDSIKNASATIVYGLMSWYQNNQSSTAATAIGTLPAPYYWWEAGAVWGGMIDYWAYTNDTSYVATVQQALLAQVGPDNNYMMPAYYSSLGNDDQDFWAMAVLAAIEYDFPVPAGNDSTTWYDLAVAVFNTQVPRWDTSTCNGGLRWQIFQSNAGYDYKNSISNGGFFQIAARLAHYTGNQTYVDWAERSYDWMTAIGLIDANYNVFDGTNDQINCSQIDHTVWTYTSGALLYGTAMMYNYTNGSQLWENRTTGLLSQAADTFFSPYKNATNIMYETACETLNTCDNDQYSFKAYLSRWMAKSAIVAPYITSLVTELLTTSAEAAARSCSGGVNGTTCGEHWYYGTYDGVYGIGQELSALETVQSLLLLRGDVNATRRYPQTQANVHVDAASASSTLSLGATSTSAAETSATSKSTARSSGAEAMRGVDRWAVGVWAAAIGTVVGGAFGVDR
ncbi:glycoside hydrolase family 76 protein [Teratosphaeria destructans]|uniref:Mannan endo-1,6-alpha-mannosidase n=1 Tax=Teratosphaeria destructans TaxID=418781 RepID=A0A9W7VYG8_9PEZI|nr:glycoside hydrolase family 76 protein [Teratosphaeria destructans]